MANSKKSRRRDLRSHVAGVLARFVKPDSQVALGLSGGIDSMALLDILQALSKKMHFALSAIHVNHQLSPNAGRWAQFCRRRCNALDIPIRILKVKVGEARRTGVEAAAREARYRAFVRQRANYVALAHHLDDQAETMMLQLLRGSGVKGLSAMPETRHPGQKSAPRILRPLLDVSREEIERYARSRKLKWIEDDSNANTAFDRNFLRHKVFPVISRRFHAYRKTLGRASRHFAEAAALLDELAESDMNCALEGGRLRAAALRELSPARARNLLRYYIAQKGLLMPSAKRLGEILRQVAYARGDATVRVAMDNLEVRRFQGGIYICPSRYNPDPKFCITWRGETRLEISELGGAMAFRRCKGYGINYVKLLREPVTIRLRRGGEKLRPNPNRPRRRLKDLLQESKIPPWERYRLPLLFSGEHLVFVPGIGIDCNYHAGVGQRGLSVTWNLNDGEVQLPSDSRSARQS